MAQDLKLELKLEVVEDLELYSEILKKDVNTILNEALEQYFESEKEKILDKNQNNENAMTNLSYDEFWDDIEI